MLIYFVFFPSSDFKVKINICFSFQGPSAKFTGLPEETILTMHHHIPDNWLIEPVK